MKKKPWSRPSLIGLLSLIIFFQFTGLKVWAQEGKNLRIISLYAAHTEMILRLGGREALVGISRQETYEGPQTEQWIRPAVFSVQDDVEKYLAAKPDIVLIRPQHLASAPHLFDTLKKSGIQIWVKQIVKASELYDYWLELGQLIGQEKEAEKIILDFQNSLKPYEEEKKIAKKHPGVFLESIHREIKTFTPQSIPVWLLELAGGYNVAFDAPAVRDDMIVAEYGAERLLSKALEIDIFIAQEGQMNHTPLKIIKERDIYQALAAFQKGKVYKISEDILARPTPSLLEGLEQLRALIEPVLKD